MPMVESTRDSRKCAVRRLLHVDLYHLPHLQALLANPETFATGTAQKVIITLCVTCHVYAMPGSRMSDTGILKLI